jgi:hypothetical protein
VADDAREDRERIEAAPIDEVAVADAAGAHAEEDGARLEARGLALL